MYIHRVLNGTSALTIYLHCIERLMCACVSSSLYTISAACLSLFFFLPPGAITLSTSKRSTFQVVLQVTSSIRSVAFTLSVLPTRPLLRVCLHTFFVLPISPTPFSHASCACAVSVLVLLPQTHRLYTIYPKFSFSTFQQ